MAKTVLAGVGKNRLLSGVALGLAVLANAGTAQAQDTAESSAQPSGTAAADESGDSGLEAIVVTAQKRSESLQDTPLAVSATGGEELDRRGITSVDQIDALAPSVSLAQQNGINRLFIRGVGLSGFSNGVDPSTAFHVDGVVIGRAAAQLSSFFDIERVEVLRGPQGTLYGRNATAGSVNLITRQPTRSPSAYLDATFGNYDLIQLQGAVSGPLNPDESLTGRIAFQTIDHDGYGQNVFLNKDVDDQKARAVRGTLRYAGAGFDVTVTGDYATEDDRNYAVYSFGPFIPGTVLLGQTLGGQQVLGQRKVASEILPVNDRRNWGLAATANIDVMDDLQLRSITGYRKFRRFNESDVENTSASVASFAQTEITEQFSQELQAIYTGERLTGIFGLYYYTEDLTGFLSVPFPAIGTIFRFPDARIFQDGKGAIDAYAAFGQLTYELTDALSATVGLRYSSEKRTSEGFYTIFNFSFPTPANVTTPVGYDETYHALTPRFALEFRPVDDVLLYASATRGFKSGAQVLGSTNPPVAPEYIWSYEAGAKATVLDRKLELALTGFIYDYTDLQINRPQGLSSILLNAAAARVKGLELEARAAPVEGLTLQLGASYLDAKFTDFPTVSPVYTTEGAINLKDNRLANAPEWTVNAAIEYALPIDMPGELSVRGDLKYTSRLFFTEYNDGSKIVFPNGFTYFNDIQSQPGVTTIDASLRYVTENERFSVTLFGRNLTNELIIANNIVGIAPFGYPVGGTYKPPRTYGVTLGFRY